MNADASLFDDLPVAEHDRRVVDDRRADAVKAEMLLALVKRYRNSHHLCLTNFRRMHDSHPKDVRCDTCKQADDLLNGA